MPKLTQVQALVGQMICLVFQMLIDWNNPFFLAGVTFFWGYGAALYAWHVPVELSSTTTSRRRGAG